MWSDGRQVPPGGGKPRALLAALLLDAGRVVTVERLMEAIWRDDPPPTARGVLQTYVASLRRAFVGAGLPEIIVSHRVGYAAEIPPDTLDKDVFERLVEQGRRAAHEGGHREAGDSFRAALALWRGPALGGIGDSYLRAEAARLEELRLAVLEERIAADLAAGGGENLIDELTELVSSAACCASWSPASRRPARWRSAPPATEPTCRRRPVRRSRITAFPDIPPEARRNRDLLGAALASAGFVNYPTEWWHWSYGDRYWAFTTGNRYARYATNHGPSEMPPLN
jgi:hypothetical protein